MHMISELPMKYIETTNVTSITKLFKEFKQVSRSELLLQQSNTN